MPETQPQARSKRHMTIYLPDKQRPLLARVRVWCQENDRSLSEAVYYGLEALLAAEEGLDYTPEE